MIDQTVLGADSLLDLGAVIAIVLAVIVATWKTAGAIAKLNSTMVQMRDNMKDLASALDGRATHTEIVTWVRLLRAQNPDIQVPTFPDRRI